MSTEEKYNAAVNRSARMKAFFRIAGKPIIIGRMFWLRGKGDDFHRVSQVRFRRESRRLARKARLIRENRCKR